MVFIAVGDGIFARVSENMELLRATPTNLSGIRVHDAKLQPEALENRDIGCVHTGVAGIETGLIEIERIRVFHDELSRAHDAEPGSNLIPKLGLNLVVIDR